MRTWQHELQNKHKGLVRLACSSLLLLGLTTHANAAIYVTIIEGLEGMPEYGERFRKQSEQALTASIALVGEEQVTAFSGDEARREALLDHFSGLATQMTENDRAAIYLIGHGSFDGENYKFNIPGVDLSASDIDTLLSALPGSKHFLVNTSSTSGAMLETLEDENRILISATRNGNERNATEFGTYFMNALSSEEADLNKNNTISIQEAFDFADRGVTDFYEAAGKLATEHPQLRGDSAAAFNIGQVVALAATPSSNENPEHAELIERRRAIDEQIETLQLNRNQYSNGEYTTRLRELILQSAEIRETLDRLQAEQEN